MLGSLIRLNHSLVFRFVLVCMRAMKILPGFLILCFSMKRGATPRNPITRIHARHLVEIVSALAMLARRCLACRARRGPLGVLPKAKRSRGAQGETRPCRQVCQSSKTRVRARLEIQITGRLVQITRVQ